MLNASVSFSILMFVSAICVVVITFFVCKLIIDLNKLTNSANMIANNVQQEIGPTLKELKETAKSINSMTNDANTKFQNSKSGIISLLTAGGLLGGKLKSFFDGISKGVSFGINLFKKK